MEKINNNITYLGRTFRTSLSKPLTDEEYNDIVETIRRKPTIEEAHAELMKIYRLQWAFMFNEDGSSIDAKDYYYHDTVFEYEDFDEAMEDRIKLMAESKDKYIRIIEVD